MPRQQPTTSVAILGANTVVENALAQLLEGEGYSTRVLKPSPLRGAQGEEMPLGVGGADLVVLAPSLSTSECDAFLAARRRTTPHRTPPPPSSPIHVLHQQSSRLAAHKESASVRREKMGYTGDTP